MEGAKFELYIYGRYFKSKSKYSEALKLLLFLL